MSRPCKISVIVPCFNHGEFVAEAVESALATKRDDLELIVVDDGSTDERTRTAMKELNAQGVKVIRQRNRGLSAARNAGILACRGECVFPLDADDRMRSAWIDRALEILDENPRVGVAFGDAQLFGTKEGRWPGAPFELEQILEQNCIPASALYRRAVWEQNGGYDETMLLGFEDWDFWLGALERGWNFEYLPEVFFEYRKAAESMLTRVQGRRAEAEDFIAKKHGALYRRALLRQMKEGRSIKRTAGRLTELVLRRTKNRVKPPFDGGWRPSN